MKHQIILLGKDITSVYHGIKEFGADHIHLLYTDATDHIETPMYRCCLRASDATATKLNLTMGTTWSKFAARFTKSIRGSLPITFPKERRSWHSPLSPLPKNQEPMLSIWHNTAKSSHLSHFENHPLQTTLNNDEILSLSGNTLTTYHDAKGLSDGDVKASMRIKQFIEQYPQEHARIQKFFSIFCKRQLNRLPASKIFANNLRFKQRTVPSWSL